MTPSIDRRRALTLSAACVLGAGSAVAGAAPAVGAVGAVGPVPDAVRARYGLDTGFYARYLDAWGIPVLGSARVGDAALEKARARLGTLLWTYPAWPVGELDRRNARVVIVARGEVMSSIPEVRAAFGLDLDERYWGGFGATDFLPITAGTEANLVDGQGGEDVFVHEFAHTLDGLALRHVDPRFLPDLRLAWAATRNNGRWTNTYARANMSEYFAEGLQSYFDVNRPGPRGGDGVHNQIATRAALQTYDRPLFALLDRIYRGARLT